jgi:hypothetical protein
MTVQILGESLRMAIDQSFEVSEERKNEIEAETNECSKLCLEHTLGLITANQQPGLRFDLAVAFTGGDAEDIETLSKIAHEQGEAGVARHFARIAVQKKVINSKIEHEQRTKWNKYGYLL